MCPHLVHRWYSMFEYDIYYSVDHCVLHWNSMSLEYYHHLTKEPNRQREGIDPLEKIVFCFQLTPPSFFDRPIKPVHVSAPHRQWKIVSPRNSDSTPYSNVNSSPEKKKKKKISLISWWRGHVSRSHQLQSLVWQIIQRVNHHWYSIFPSVN